MKTLDIAKVVMVAESDIVNTARGTSQSPKYLLNIPTLRKERLDIEARQAENPLSAPTATAKGGF